MTDQSARAQRFLALHDGPGPLLLRERMGRGHGERSSRRCGFEALATTSSGHAATLGRLDGSVTRDEAIAHAAAIVAATELPVSADLENCFADDPDGVAETIRLALGAGLAGCSIEDHTRTRRRSDLSARAGRRARRGGGRGGAHEGPVHLVLTARAENHVHGRDDLDDTIARLLAYQAAGADVLYPTGSDRPRRDPRRGRGRRAAGQRARAPRAARRSASSPRPGSAASRSAARSRSRRSARSSRPPRSCARTAPTASSRSRRSA